ncbi:Protein of unknown function [Gryllus bimaculatus]|nr:Protein of unknown function [Gryllus bimaculatus]
MPIRPPASCRRPPSRSASGGRWASGGERGPGDGGGGGGVQRSSAPRDSLGELRSRMSNGEALVQGGFDNILRTIAKTVADLWDLH